MKKGLAISLFLVISLLLIQSGNDLVQAKDGIERGIKIAGYQFILFDLEANPQPGLWEGTGNFDGSFTVSADSTKITNLNGSFDTDLCGEIDVPGDLNPPAETTISNDDFTIFMEESGTLNFLSIKGTFTSDTTMEGDFGWGVDGCGFGGRISIDATWKEDKTTPTTEPPTPTTEPIPTTEPPPMGKLVLSMVIRVEATNNAKPGQWVGSGNFDGLFTVSADSSRIMDFSGSFNTFTCGKIAVPGDLDPPAEIAISGNKFSITMSEAGTTDFLNIEGTFTSDTTMIGDYGWSVDGCGMGGRILFAAEWQNGSTSTPTPEPGQWKGTGNFDGTFTVSENSSLITNLSGSFDTLTCGKIAVPGDLAPPAETSISDNEFSILMEESGTLNFLSIEGSFPFTTTMEGDFGWGVDGCGIGGRNSIGADWFTETLTTDSLFETILYMPEETGYATIPDNDSLDLGVGDGEDFTIEVFFYVPDLDYDDTFADLIARKKESYSLSISFNNGQPDWIIFEIWTDLFNSVNFGIPLDIQTGWHHLAAVYDNEFTENEDMLAIFFDGDRIGYSPDETLHVDWTPGIPNSLRKLEVGGVQGGQGFYGYLEEIRQSSIVRYNGSTYTVPTEPFTTDANTRALWHFNEIPGSITFADDSIYNNDLTGGDGAQTYKP